MDKEMELLKRIDELEKKMDKIDERTYRTWQRLCEVFREVKEAQLDHKHIIKLIETYGPSPSPF